MHVELHGSLLIDLSFRECAYILTRLWLFLLHFGLGLSEFVFTSTDALLVEFQLKQVSGDFRSLG